MVTYFISVECGITMWRSETNFWLYNRDNNSSVFAHSTTLSLDPIKVIFFRDPWTGTHPWLTKAGTEKSWKYKQKGSVWWWRSRRSTLTEISASHQSFWPLFLLNEPPRDSSSLIPRYWLCSNLSKFSKNIFYGFGELLWFWIINRKCHVNKNFHIFVQIFFNFCF